MTTGYRLRDHLVQLAAAQASQGPTMTISSLDVSTSIPGDTVRVNLLDAPSSSGRSVDIRRNGGPWVSIDSWISGEAAGYVEFITQGVHLLSGVGDAIYYGETLDVQVTDGAESDIKLASHTINTAVGTQNLTLAGPFTPSPKIFWNDSNASNNDRAHIYQTSGAGSYTFFSDGDLLGDGDYIGEYFLGDNETRTWLGPAGIVIDVVPPGWSAGPVSQNRVELAVEITGDPDVLSSVSLLVRDEGELTIPTDAQFDAAVDQVGQTDQTFIESIVVTAAAHRIYYRLTKASNAALKTYGFVDVLPADSIAPTASPGTIDPTGLLVTIPIDEQIIIGSTVAGNFVLAGVPLTNLRVSGQDLLLDAVTPILGGLPLSIDYNAPEEDGIADLPPALNLLASFSGLALTNSSTATAAQEAIDVDGLLAVVNLNPLFTVQSNLSVTEVNVLPADVGASQDFNPNVELINAVSASAFIDYTVLSTIQSAVDEIGITGHVAGVNFVPNIDINVSASAIVASTSTANVNIVSDLDIQADIEAVEIVVPAAFPTLPRDILSSVPALEVLEFPATIDLLFPTLEFQATFAALEFSMPKVGIVKPTNPAVVELTGVFDNVIDLTGVYGGN